MTYRNFTVKKDPLETLGALWGFYGMKTARISEEEENISTVYPREIIGNAEVHIYISKSNSCPKIMLIGEKEEIEHTKINIERVVKTPLQPTP